MRIVTVLVAGLLLIATPAHAELKHDQQCRKNTSPKIARCFARDFGGRSLVRKALAVGRCESGLDGREAAHADPYHGEYQYLVSTFHSQQNQIPAQVSKYDLGGEVHNDRANIGTAVIWASKYGWGPWSCA